MRKVSLRMLNLEINAYGLLWYSIKISENILIVLLFSFNKEWNSHSSQSIFKPKFSPYNLYLLNNVVIVNTSISKPSFWFRTWKIITFHFIFIVIVLCNSTLRGMYLWQVLFFPDPHLISPLLYQCLWISLARSLFVYCLLALLWFRMISEVSHASSLLCMRTCDVLFWTV